MELSITSSRGFAILVPAGARHNVINGPSGPLRRTIAMTSCMLTKADAEADEEHFDEKTRIGIYPASGRTVPLQSRCTVTFSTNPGFR